MEERLQKVLAQAGVASRRASEELIKSGKIKINGQTVTELGLKVDPAKDKIEVNGKPLRGREKHVYIMLNKPVGYITTMKDQFNRPTVLDLVKDVPERLHSVGRLDYETEGLILLTNDGELTYALTHPSQKIDKTYLVTVKGPISGDALYTLAKGVRLEDGITAPAKVKLITRGRNSSTILLTIYEGRNRQVRRMLEAVGYPVWKLRRIQLGVLELGELKPGEYRQLSKKEIALLKGIEKSMNH